jgi:hypothetical protein
MGEMKLDISDKICVQRNPGASGFLTGCMAKPHKKKECCDAVMMALLDDEFL